MGTLEDLREIYEAFCAFGSNRNLASPHSSMDAIGGPTMDGAKFAKFARDNKLLDKRVTSTDVDLVFNKIKPKGARKIDWNTFLEGLTQIAEKKYAGKQGREALDSLVAVILKKGGGPIATGTTPKNDAIVDRLTDTSKYTGTHKLRFDEAGHGKGIEGRDRPNPTSDLSKITNREETSVRGLPVSIDPNERGGSAVNKMKSPKGSNTNLAKPKTAEKSYGTASKSGGSVFDRLTDTQQYTGSHRHRFNADGTGSPSKSQDNVNDLSQILRS